MQEETQDDHDVEYGIRQSRSSTSYEHRDSSSLHVAQTMEHDIYYSTSETILNHCISIATNIRALLPYSPISRQISTLGTKFILWPSSSNTGAILGS
jgi:hypothetical protein